VKPTPEQQDTAAFLAREAAKLHPSIEVPPSPAKRVKQTRAKRKQQLVPGKAIAVSRAESRARVAKAKAVETKARVDRREQLGRLETEERKAERAIEVYEAEKVVLEDVALKAVLKGKVHMIAASLTPEAVMSANLVQKTTALGILFDKIQLLEGKPTAITAINDRRSVDQLLHALLEEAKRRKIDIPGEFKDVTPKEAA
jgi:hypothetical protein